MNAQSPALIQIGLLGFGEAGQAFADTLPKDKVALFAYDVVFSSPEEAPARYAKMRDCAAQNQVACCASPAELAASSKFIFSLVTADDCAAAARAIASDLTEHHIFFESNSVSPGTKKTNAQLAKKRGAGFIDMAIMAPVAGRGHATPALLSGTGEAQLKPILEMLGFSARWAGQDIGQASVTKMLRSILIKGMESLVSESMAAAVELGLDTEILTTAGKTLRIDDMPGLADYVMERVARHGGRRAAEMREVAKTLTELGLSNHMASAIASHQQMIADMKLADQHELVEDRSVLAPLFAAGQRNS